MSSTLSADTRALIRAADGLTTQVRRIADAMQTPVVEVAEATDDDAATPAAECSAQYHGDGYSTECIRAAHHPGVHIDTKGFSWTERYAVYPTDEGPELLGMRVGIDPGAEPGTVTVIGHWLPMSEQQRQERQELAGMVSEFVDAQVQHAWAADHAEQRTARRASLLNLLARLQRGGMRAEESVALRKHVEAEIRDADTARTRAEQTEQLLSVAHTTSNRSEAARAEEERLRLALAAERDHWKERTEKQGRRASALERELRTLRSGLRANGADPTQIQNLWAQISLRNRQWREAKREVRVTRSMLEAEGGDVSLVDEMLDTVAATEAKVREAEAAIERVRALLPTNPADDEAVVRVSYPQLRAALDGTEQPTSGNRLCHATDPTTLRECARKHQHDGPHQDGDLEWPAEQPSEGDSPEALRAKVDEATATLRRVRAEVQWISRNYPALHAVNNRLVDALAGPRPDRDEQPTTEQPASNFAAYQAAIARVILVLREAQDHREQTDPSERQDCVMCGADHLAEIRAAIKGKPTSTEEH